MDHLIESRIVESEIWNHAYSSFDVFQKSGGLVRQLWTGYLVRGQGSVEWNAVVLDSPESTVGREGHRVECHRLRGFAVARDADPLEAGDHVTVQVRLVDRQRCLRCK